MDSQPSNVRPGHRDPHAHAADQPFSYPLKREFVEPDWTRLPGYRDVTKDQWESAQWQRAHTVKNLKEFAEALGDHLDPELLEDIRRDQEERATMSMLLPPQMINTMREDNLRGDPVRRYMAGRSGAEGRSSADGRRPAECYRHHPGHRLWPLVDAQRAH